jgi:hypothetical protein
MTAIEKMTVGLENRKIDWKKYVTSIMQGRTDVDIRAFRLSYVGYRRLDCVEGSYLYGTVYIQLNC